MLLTLAFLPQMNLGEKLFYMVLGVIAAAVIRRLLRAGTSAAISSPCSMVIDHRHVHVLEREPEPAPSTRYVDVEADLAPVDHVSAGALAQRRLR